MFVADLIASGSCSRLLTPALSATCTRAVRARVEIGLHALHSLDVLLKTVVAHGFLTLNLSRLYGWVTPVLDPPVGLLGDVGFQRIELTRRIGEAGLSMCSALCRTRMIWLGFRGPGRKVLDRLPRFLLC